MDFVLELLKLLVPAGIVFATTYYLINKYIQQESEKRALELKKGNKEASFPLRVQAYERAVLFLERISPNNLVMRLHKNTTAKAFQRELLDNIRTEYDHNMAQQLYVSDQAWNTLKNAKEEIVKLINMAAQQLNEHATSIELSQKIFEIAAEYENMPSDIAISVIKKEAHQLF